MSNSSTNQDYIRGLENIILSRMQSGSQYILNGRRKYARMQSASSGGKLSETHLYILSLEQLVAMINQRDNRDEQATI